MFSKQNVLIVLAVLLGGIYIYYFTDWINHPHIQIIVTSRDKNDYDVTNNFKIFFLLLFPIRMICLFGLGCEIF